MRHLTFALFWLVVKLFQTAQVFTSCLTMFRFVDPSLHARQGPNLIFLSLCGGGVDATCDKLLPGLVGDAPCSGSMAGGDEELTWKVLPVTRQYLVPVLFPVKLDSDN